MFGSSFTNSGLWLLPRKVAFWPGVMLPSAMTCGNDTNVATPFGAGASLLTTLPYAGNRSTESRSRWSSVGGGTPVSE